MIHFEQFCWQHAVKNQLISMATDVAK